MSVNSCKYLRFGIVNNTEYYDKLLYIKQPTRKGGLRYRVLSKTLGELCEPFTKGVGWLL